MLSPRSVSLFSFRAEPNDVTIYKFSEREGDLMPSGIGMKLLSVRPWNESEWIVHCNLLVWSRLVWSGLVSSRLVLFAHSASCSLWGSVCSSELGDGGWSNVNEQLLECVRSKD